MVIENVERRFVLVTQRIIQHKLQDIQKYHQNIFPAIH